MLTVIKTGIVTIILSFISGVLLDYYKNRAPRIVCNISGGKDVKNAEKNTRLYTVTVRNISKKTIHNLNLNLHAKCEEIGIKDAKITKGLKFDVSDKGNSYDISIPFLSKNDEFSVNVLLEDSQIVNSIPLAALRSPESFKIIKSGKNKLKDVKEKTSNNRNRNKKGISILNNLLKNKKVVIALATVLVAIFTGVFVLSYFGKTNANVGSSYDDSNKPDSSQNVDNSPSKTETESNKKSSSSAKSKDGSKSKPSNGTSNDENNKNSSSSANENKKSTNEEKNSSVNKPEDNTKNSSEKGKSSSSSTQDSNKESTNGSSTENSGEKTTVQGAK